ncbi:P-loop containing nucleoside triphosphate hydrolase protein, partial [Mycena vulgaris]
MLNEIAQYAGTLQKFYTCLRDQNELGKFKRLFKQNDITLKLNVCEGELRVASDIFIAQSGVSVASTLVEMELDTERRHQDLLELIYARSASFTTASSVIQSSAFGNSSGSLSLLPGSPKIFHGRNSELSDLIETLFRDSARVVVLGPGGIGKTTLAMAAIHHAAVMEKYHSRYFISCESAKSSADLVSIIGSHLGLEPSRQLSKAIVCHFEESGKCLIMLDNLETPWEPLESRAGVEEFLSLLADVPDLALLITMRGAQRPGKVKWTRPFLHPLEPLSPSASREIFLAVADDPEMGEDNALDELINLSGSLPLAISLMARIASFEGYSSTLSRWRVENTTLLSDGHDKQSNLEMSIILSLGSPRISSSPQAKELLSLLSLLPDGITDEDLVTSKVPLADIAHCRSSLVQTSLAYIDVRGRLKALNPVREYMRRVQPPSPSLSKPLRTHF